MEPGPINPWWTVDESLEDVPAPVRGDRETAARSTESAAHSEQAGQKGGTKGLGKRDGEPDRPELE